jgi:hypothetical protein
MKFSSILIVAFFAISFNGFSQNHDYCGYEHANEYLESIYPGYKDGLNKEYLENVEYIKRKQHRRTVNEFDTVYKLQVVFHVLHNTPQENLDDSLILSQLKILNEDFRRTNPDTGVTRDVFKPVAGDAKIEFVMAAEDPQGNPTNGINRVQTTRSTFYQNGVRDLMKKSSNGGADSWDGNKYLNIWVCNYSHPILGDLILGYAYPPVGVTNWPSGNSTNQPIEHQGVVLHYKIVGYNNPNANTATTKRASGRTGVHEVGHYLSLRHTWGDPPRNVNGCDVDDFIDDTPLTRSAAGFSSTCNHLINSCNEGPGDLPSMIENYMDYSPNVCQNLFTQQQVDLMRYVLVKLRPGMAVDYRLDKNPDYIEPVDVIAIYPNPASDEVTIEIGELNEGNYRVIFHDVVGRQVIKTDLTTGLNSINTSLMLNGVYYASVLNENDSEVYFTKLVIAR